MKTIANLRSGGLPGFPLTYAATALLLMVTAWACNQNGAAAPRQSEKTVDPAAYSSMRASFNSLEGEWLLTTYQHAPLPVEQQNKASLVLKKQSPDAMQMGGKSFVNWYGGTFRLDETEGLIVSAEPIIQTFIAGPPQLTEAETRHIDGLSKVYYFELDTNQQLKLYLGEKSNPATEVMVYTRK